MTQPSLTRPKAIAVFWHRADGTACYLHKRESGWWLTIERENRTLREESLSSPRDAYPLAQSWISYQPDPQELAG